MRKSLLFGMITFIAIIAMFSIFLFGLVGCSPDNSKDTYDEFAEENNPFAIVYSEYDYTVVYHKNTKVMYVYSKTVGNFTMLVNADGTPLLYKGEIK